MPHRAAFIVRIYEGCGLLRDDDDDTLAFAEALEALAADLRSNPMLLAGPIRNGASIIGDFKYAFIRDPVVDHWPHAAPNNPNFSKED